MCVPDMTTTRRGDHKPKGDEDRSTASPAADHPGRTLPTWEAMYDQLVDYKRRSPTNDANVPEDGGLLGWWLAYQREKFHKGELSAECLDLLEDVGVCMRPLHVRGDHKPKVDEAQSVAGPAADHPGRTLPTWEAMYDQLVDYKRRSPTNDANAPKDGGALGRWLAYQREKYNKGELSAERLDLLEALGVCMRPLHVRWETQFNAAVRYKCKTGEWPPTTHPIGSWAAQQRQLLKRHQTTKWRMHPYRLNKLLAVGMVINLQQATWKSHLAWLEEWAKEKKFQPLPRTEEFSYISRWCKSQARTFTQSLPTKAATRKIAIERRRLAAPLMVPYFQLDQPAEEEESTLSSSPRASAQSTTQQFPTLPYTPADVRGGPCQEPETTRAPVAAAAVPASPRRTLGKRRLQLPSAERLLVWSGPFQEPETTRAPVAAAAAPASPRRTLGKRRLQLPSVERLLVWSGPFQEPETKRARAAAAAPAASPWPTFVKRPRSLPRAEPPWMETVTPEPRMLPLLAAAAAGASSPAPVAAQILPPLRWPARGTREAYQADDAQRPALPSKRLPSVGELLEMTSGKRSADPPVDEMPGKRRRTRQ